MLMLVKVKEGVYGQSWHGNYVTMYHTIRSVGLGMA
jgi:hypothetical protein